MLIDTSPVNCPYCRTSDRTRQTSDTGRVRAWSCDHCGTDWAFSLVRPDSRAAALLGDLSATAREVRRLRGTLRQVITLATDSPHLADVELRARLLGLASEAAP